jgi:hypothetical protein
MNELNKYKLFGWIGLIVLGIMISINYSGFFEYVTNGRDEYYFSNGDNKNEVIQNNKLSCDFKFKNGFCFTKEKGSLPNEKKNWCFENPINTTPIFLLIKNPKIICFNNQTIDQSSSSSNKQVPVCFDNNEDSQFIKNCFNVYKKKKV